MPDTDIKDRAAGAVIGAFIGDALGVGPHWYYDLEELRREFGDWIDDYHAPRPGRYHEGLEAGQNSQTGQVAGLLLESAAERKTYDEKDFCARLDGLLETLDGTPQGGRYTDQAMRDVWKGRREGRPWSEAAGFSDTAEAAVRTPVLAALAGEDTARAAEYMKSNVRLTHRAPFVAGRSTAFGLIVSALINGRSLAGASSYIGRALRKQGVELSVPTPGGGEHSFFDACLQPGWSAAAAEDQAVSIDPPQMACRLFGLACSLDFMLPAAYYFASRFEGDFETAVLSAINGGGNNMARAALTGALAGAQAGLSGIPERFVEGLAEKERLVEMARTAAGA